jgi:Flp pilus assembly pilin Flp
MRHQTRALLRDNFRRAEQRARLIELGLIAVAFVAVGLLRRRW